MQTLVEEKPAWLTRQIPVAGGRVSVEILLVALIMLLALFSRFYILGERVMSHDEVNHVVPSYELFSGSGYRHDPVTHGPFQFHAIALTYFLLGDNDFTSRLPHALFSVATVFFAWWGFRRYLGRTGGVLAALFFLISPFALFYGRYARNEAFVGLYALVMLWSLLRYLEDGRPRWLFLFTLSVAMHVATKETAFIYIAQALVFLAGLFLYRVLYKPWPRPERLRPFLLLLILALVLLAGGLGGTLSYIHDLAVADNTATPAAGAETAPVPEPARVGLLPGLLFAGGVLALVGAVVVLAQSYGRERLRQERSFDLLVLLATLSMPLLAAFPVHMIGFNPLGYTNNPDIIATTGTVVALFLAAAAIGWWWNLRLWLPSAGLFYAVFTVLYTTLFTNGLGFATGLVGSLGYWLSQQGEYRGGQPIYYFALLQIPMYEYLAALGTVLALVLAWRRRVFAFPLPDQPADTTALTGEPPAAVAIFGDGNGSDPNGDPDGEPVSENEPAPAAARLDSLPVLALLLFWAVTSLAAYSVAGEKMPWLTYHISIPMLLCAAWGFGDLIDRTPWRRLGAQRAWLVVLVLPVLVLALGGVVSSWMGENRPFSGSELSQYQATATFVFSLLALFASGAALTWLLREWTTAELLRVVGLALAALLAVQTARASIRANYINYDNAKEFLVYAHAARGPKDILEQVEEISERISGGTDIVVAYDNDGLYPYWWYFRRYPNKNFYAGSPTRELRNDPLIIASEANFDKMDTITGEAYNHFQYYRLWWPMQDYWNLTWERLRYALFNPDMRAALFDIWLNADYTRYAALRQTLEPNRSNDLTLTTWQPSDEIRLYVRKDVVSQIWNYGVGPSEVVQADPYEAGTLDLSADLVVGGPGSEPLQFNAPRAVAAAPDGTLYVADSRNHRIQHVGPDGQVITVFGAFGDANADANGDGIADGAPGGALNEPWGVAVGPDGSVYVADTWNNRVQKFTPQGEFVTMWGYFGQAEAPEAFWGPRGVAVDSQGRVYVTDTGNKRVVVFDGDGGYVTQFGGSGFDPGQFSEPVGIAIGADNMVFVADTWNQRMQAFLPDAGGQTFLPVAQWDIAGWFGQSLENKPFVAVDGQGRVLVTDPEASRILQFNPDGTFVRSWGDFGSGPNGFGLAAGVAVDPQGQVWVTDAGNHRLMRFVVPE